jgi:hypothetical protein
MTVPDYAALHPGYELPSNLSEPINIQQADQTPYGESLAKIQYAIRMCFP